MTAVLPGRRPGAASVLPPAGGRRPPHGGRVRPADRTLGRLTSRLAGRLGPWVVRAIMGLALLVFLLLALGPHLLGYRTMTMLTGSMAPEIEPGDVVVVTPIHVTDVAEGMVITYHQPVGDRSLVTHRVVAVDTAVDGAVTVRTKGDANEAADPWAATLQGDTAFRVRAVVPELGHLVQVLRAPVLTQVLTYVVPALLAGWVLLTIWRPTRHGEAGR